MIILTAAAFIICAALIAVNVSLIRQIKNIRRRLDFIRSHKTNMRVTSDTPFRPANELIDSINELIDKTESERIALEKESAGLKESIAGISHDLRTPLTSLSGYFQLLSNTDDSSERERYTRIINSRVTDLEAMLEELFTYTKLQNSDYELEMSRVDLTKCVVDAMLGFYGQFSERGIAPRTDIDEERIYINGNEEAIRRILQNILKNALVHSAGDISVSLCRQDKTAVFKCSNKINPSDEIDPEQVFKKFYKADPARKDTSTGLGLTIAYELAKRICGKLSASVDGDVFSAALEFDLF